MVTSIACEEQQVIVINVYQVQSTLYILLSLISTLKFLHYAKYILRMYSMVSNMLLYTVIIFTLLSSKYIISTQVFVYSQQRLISSIVSTISLRNINVQGLSY